MAMGFIPLAIAGGVIVLWPFAYAQCDVSQSVTNPEFVLRKADLRLYDGEIDCASPQFGFRAVRDAHPSRVVFMFLAVVLIQSSL